MLQPDGLSRRNAGTGLTRGSQCPVVVISVCRVCDREPEAVAQHVNRRAGCGLKPSPGSFTQRSRSSCSLRITPLFLARYFLLLLRRSLLMFRPFPPATPLPKHTLSLPPPHPAFYFLVLSLKQLGRGCSSRGGSARLRCPSRASCRVFEGARSFPRGSPARGILSFWLSGLVRLGSSCVPGAERQERPGEGGDVSHQHPAHLPPGPRQSRRGCPGPAAAPVLMRPGLPQPLAALPEA